ncbi:MAG: hypothetical protein KGJ86_13605, partial [Chloroflexota bacterium]|nr:hypothetical protein [Chloroflexota bacterium]
RSGEIAAAVGLDPAGQPDLRTVLPAAEQVEAEWSRKTAIQPINHVLALRTDLLEAHPWVAGELWKVFRESDRQSQASGGKPAPPWGMEANRPAIETVARYAFEQGITPRMYAAEELFPLADG